MTAVALAGVACSSDSSPDANDIELTSNATSYTWIPGVPPPPLTVTLHNGSGDFLQVIVCSREGTPTAPIQYQQQQGDGSWADISFGTFVCNFPRTLVQIESGATWTLPPEGQAFPLTRGPIASCSSPRIRPSDFQSFQTASPSTATTKARPRENGGDHSIAPAALLLTSFYVVTPSPTSALPSASGACREAGCQPGRSARQPTPPAASRRR